MSFLFKKSGLCRPAIPPRSIDEEWMGHALALAKEAIHAGEVPVGALILQGDQILGQAYNKVEDHANALHHAEILAIEQAQKVLGDWRLTECTLYVTKEPCVMCAGALLNTRLGRVVFGLYDHKAGACGGATNVLALPEVNHFVDCLGGVREEEAKALIQQFFRKARKRSSLIKGT